MVAGRHNIDAGIEDFAGGIDCYSRAARGILAIGNDQVQLVGLAQLWQKLTDGVPARLAYDVADKKKLHCREV